MSMFEKVWDASPITETHTLRLTVDSSRKWPLATGALAGFIVGFVLAVGLSESVDERSVKRGTFYSDGKLYKLTQIEVPK